MKAGRSVTRRDFLRASALAAAALPCCRLAAAPASDPPHEALFYERQEDGGVRCTLCPRACHAARGARGYCEVRENRNGEYVSLVYGFPCSIQPDDPIQKKPFFHVYPGSKAYSIATVGCNIDCKFCQNWEISQARPENTPVRRVTPAEIAAGAAASGARTVAYTYTEPTIFYEYMVDCCRAVRERGLGNVVVSNGFISAEPLNRLCREITAIKIDLKGFTETFYADLCDGQLAPVLESLQAIRKSGTWLEIVNLVIPGHNDNRDDLKRMAAWIVEKLGPDVPVHFTRYHPAYKIQNIAPTPVETLADARRIALEAGCHFVYVGNIPGGEGARTYCPSCRTLVLDRYVNLVVSNALKAGACPSCGTAIPGIWA